jgi:hypothetical protein
LHFHAKFGLADAVPGKLPGLNRLDGAALIASLSVAAASFAGPF